MKRLAISLVILALLAGFGFWWFSDTQVLKRRSQSLLTTLTLDSGKGKVGRQMGAYSLNALLAEQVQLDTPTIKEANGSFQRDELEAAYSWLCNQAKETRFELQNFRSVTVNGDKATVDLTLVGLVVLPQYRPVDGTFDVTYEWQKEKDGWRLTRATWKQVP
jgi:hypothetical protein